MTDKPYNRGDVELVEQAIRNVSPTIVDGYVDGRDLLTAEACAVLEALAAAGRLIPADTATRTEWATRLNAHTENGIDYAGELSPVPTTLAKVQEVSEEQYAHQRAAHWRRRFGDELVDVVRRDIHTTPWRADR